MIDRDEKNELGISYPQLLYAQSPDERWHVMEYRRDGRAPDTLEISEVKRGDEGFESIDEAIGAVETFLDGWERGTRDATRVLQPKGSKR